MKTFKNMYLSIVYVANKKKGPSENYLPGPKMLIN